MRMNDGTKQTFTLEQYLKDMKAEKIRTDQECQRLSGQWNPNMVNELIASVLTDDYIPPIILGEETTSNGITRQWIIDGLQRSSTLALFRYGNTKVKKTKDINEATQFYHVNKAMRKILSKPAQCKGYYLFDTEDTYSRRKQNRKHYSQDVRKILYDKANGKCAICGKPLLFSDITLDHIIPLIQNGKDEVENLQVCCYECNQMKGAILPSDLYQKVTKIFMYQMDKKQSKRLLWKIVHKLLNKMV